MAIGDDRLTGGGGREERFQALYEKYYRRVIRFYVRAFRLPEEDAEDLAQDAFLRFFEALDEYRGEAEWAFLETIARNVAFNRIRSLHTAKRNAKTVDIDDPLFREKEPPAPAGPDYAERQQHAIRSRQLREAITDLTPRQRQSMQLWLQDLKYAEIASVLGISIDAVKASLRDAKRVLRDQLGAAGTLPEDES